MKTPYKNITVKEYQRIYPALKKAKQEYLDNAGWYDYQQFAATVLNKPYEDIIDLPESKLIKYNWYVNNSLTDAIKQNNQVWLFGKRINHSKLFNQKITIGQSQNFKDILLELEGPLKDSKVQDVFYKQADKDLELSDTENEAFADYISKVFDVRIANMHRLASIFLQPAIQKKPFNSNEANKLAEKLLNQNVFDVFLVTVFFYTRLKNWLTPFTEFLRQQICIIS